MESALYGIYALVFVSEILLVRCAHSFDFWYVNNSCVNTVRPHFPWSILYILNPLRFLKRAFQFLWKDDVTCFKVWRQQTKCRAKVFLFTIV